MQPQHFDLHNRPSQVSDLILPEVRWVASHPTSEFVDNLAVTSHVTQLTWFPLVTDDGHGQAPTLARTSDHVDRRDVSTVEGNLAELLGYAVDHPQGSLLNTGLVHRHHEGGDTAMLGHFVVGPGQDQAPLSIVGVTGPYFVAGDHIVVTPAIGPGPQRSKIGTGVRLTESLTPPLAPTDDAREKPPLNVLTAVLEDTLHQVTEARSGWCPGRGELLVDDDVIDRGQPLPTNRRGPGHAEEARVEERLVPGGCSLPVVVVGRGRRQPRVVVLQPGPQSLTEFRLFRRVSEIHLRLYPIVHQYPVDVRPGPSVDWDRRLTHIARRSGTIRLGH